MSKSPTIPSTAFSGPAVHKAHDDISTHHTVVSRTTLPPYIWEKDSCIVLFLYARCHLDLKDSRSALVMPESPDTEVCLARGLSLPYRSSWIFLTSNENKFPIQSPNRYKHGHVPNMKHLRADDTVNLLFRVHISHQPTITGRSFMNVFMKEGCNIPARNSTGTIVAVLDRIEACRARLLKL